MSEGKTAVRFHVTADRLAEVELGEFLDIQDNPQDARTIAAFMSRFITDENGEYLDEDAARLAVRKVTIGQMKSAFEKVSADIGTAAAPNE